MSIVKVEYAGLFCLRVSDGAGVEEEDASHAKLSNEMKSNMVCRVFRGPRSQCRLQERES